VALQRAPAGEAVLAGEGFYRLGVLWG